MKKTWYGPATQKICLWLYRNGPASRFAIENELRIPRSRMKVHILRMKRQNLVEHDYPRWLLTRYGQDVVKELWL